MAKLHRVGSVLLCVCRLRVEFSLCEIVKWPTTPHASILMAESILIIQVLYAFGVLRLSPIDTNQQSGRLVPQHTHTHSLTTRTGLAMAANDVTKTNEILHWWRSRLQIANFTGPTHSRTKETKRKQMKIGDANHNCLQSKFVVFRRKIYTYIYFLLLLVWFHEFSIVCRHLSEWVTFYFLLSTFPFFAFFFFNYYFLGTSTIAINISKGTNKQKRPHEKFRNECLRALAFLFRSEIRNETNWHSANMERHRREEERHRGRERKREARRERKQNQTACGWSGHNVAISCAHNHHHQQKQQQQ